MRAARARLSPVAAGFFTCGTCSVPDARVQVGKPAPTCEGDAARCRRRRGCVACGACLAVPRSRRFFYLRYMLGCPRSRRFFTCVTHSVPDAIVQVGKPAPTCEGAAVAAAVGALRVTRARLSPVAAGFLPASHAWPSPVAAGFSTCGTHSVPDAIVQVGKPAPTGRGDAPVAAVVVRALRAARAWLSPVAAVAGGTLRAARAWLSPVAAGFLPAEHAWYPMPGCR